LFEAPGRRASHAQLIAALDHAYGETDRSPVRKRLGTLVTRLRRKCHDHHESLPLKSVHGWGYMFAGAVA
jgi:DNA-binding response OmpR family regulator